jgi:hypothetical protein
MRVPAQTNYKRKTLLRRRAYKLGRNTKNKPARDTQENVEKVAPPKPTLDQFSLPQ